MTWRLVLGAIYAQRWSLVYATVMIGFLLSRQTQREWLAAGLVTLIAALAGAMAREPLARRELASLPVGAREWHRARWLLSALVPLAVLTIGRCLGGALHAVWSEGGWTFDVSAPRVVFDIVYFCLCGAAAVRPSEHLVPVYLQDPSLLRLFFGSVAFVTIPFVVIHRLPLVLDDVSAVIWIAAFVLLGIGARPLISPPSVYLRRPSPAVVSEPPALPARLRPPTTPDLASRFGGMWVPMRGVMGHAAIWTMVVICFLAVVQHLRGVVTLWWPFDSSMTDLRFLTTIAVPPMFMIGLGPSLAPWIGWLKRLPLSTHRVALLLSLAPATMPIVFWTLLLVLHFLATAQAPDALRLGLLTVFIGLVALIDALGTKSGSAAAKCAMVAPVFLGFAYAFGEHRELLEAALAHWALPLVGVLCLVLAWVVNVDTLMRSPGSARAFQIGRPTQTAGAR